MSECQCRFQSVEYARLGSRALLDFRPGGVSAKLAMRCTSLPLSIVACEVGWVGGCYMVTFSIPTKPFLLGHEDERTIRTRCLTI